MIIPFVDLKAQYFSIKEEIDSAIQNVIKDTAFVGGDYLKIFEQDFAAFVGAKHCIGVGNGTDAIYIALKCLGITEGHEVINRCELIYSHFRVNHPNLGKGCFCRL